MKFGWRLDDIWPQPLEWSATAKSEDWINEDIKMCLFSTVFTKYFVLCLMHTHAILLFVFPFADNTTSLISCTDKPKLILSEKALIEHSNGTKGLWR